MTNERKQLSSAVSARPEKLSDSDSYAAREAKYERRRKLMVALWARGSQFFGGLWEATYGSVNDQTIHGWHGALNCMSEDQLACGVRGLEKWPDKYPPTFGQFRALCLAEDAAPSNVVPDSHRLTRQADPHAVEQVRLQEVMRMAEIMLGQSPETKEESLRKLGLLDE